MQFDYLLIINSFLVGEDVRFVQIGCISSQRVKKYCTKNGDQIRCVIPYGEYDYISTPRCYRMKYMTENALQRYNDASLNHKDNYFYNVNMEQNKFVHTVEIVNELSNI